MIVDDEELLREMACLMLKKLGYEVIACKNGEEALSRYSGIWRTIDLVILDMIMPKMGGRDAFREMKKVNNDVKVLLSSGYSIREDATSILSEGVLGFIQKPFSAAELSAKIAEALSAKPASTT